MINDEYELMPHKSLEGMKKELEELRRHASNIEPKTGLPKETSSSITSLTKSINSLMDLFKKASAEMKLEDRDEQLLSKQIKPLMEKVDTLLEQNSKIAKGIIAVADMVKENIHKPEEIHPPRAPTPPPAMPPPGLPPLGEPAPGMGMPPPLGIPTEMPDSLPPLGDMPPPPGPMPGLERSKKKGFGGLFKK